MVRLIVLLLLAVLPAKADEAVRIEADLSLTSPRLQQQVVLAVRLWRSSTLQHGYLVVPEIPEALVEPLGQHEFTVERDGRNWRVEERRFALFPQRSGSLSVPPAVFSGRDSYARGPDLVLEVRPRPPGGERWLPATALRLAEHWSADEAPAGQPIERWIKAEADGLLGAQLPALPLPMLPDVEARRLEARTTTEVIDGTVVGRRIERHLLVPRRAGTIALPELAVEWWDIGTETPRLATLPARVLAVSPAGAAPTPNTSAVRLPSPPAPEDGPPWAWIALPAAGALLVTWLWWILAPGRHDRRRLAAVATAARRGDAKATRAALLDWAATGSLSAVAVRLEDAEATAGLRRLDAAVFAGNAAAWDGAAFTRRVLPALRRTARRSRARRETLPGLAP